jgi:hypothetical protein
MHYTTSERLKTIQEHLGVEPDGVLGGQTLTALEKRLLPANARQSQALATPGPATSPEIAQGLTLSQKGIDLIIHHEIGSEAYYRSKLTHPTWPGGDSGVTIGIGYDLGYASTQQFQRDWGSMLQANDVARLKRVCGIKAQRAKRIVSSVKLLEVSFEAAKHVFIHSSLPDYALKTKSTFPGVENLHADAQAALVSLVYNRGVSTRGDSRREMAAIQPLVLRQAYSEIAQEIIKMKRLWEGRGLDGLLRRRDEEAQLVARSAHTYQPDELVRLA